MQPTPGSGRRRLKMKEITHEEARELCVRRRAILPERGNQVEQRWAEEGELRRVSNDHSPAVGGVVADRANSVRRRQ